MNPADLTTMLEAYHVWLSTGSEAARDVAFAIADRSRVARPQSSEEKGKKNGTR